MAVKVLQLAKILLPNSEDIINVSDPNISHLTTYSHIFHISHLLPVCVSVLVVAVPEEAKRAKRCQTLIFRIEGVRAGVQAIL